ncbi:hypothetical protein L484_013648 [Morus notabilis]|uniref:Uncharacterized protein n=1 Tax=Morus notabilis TaxID=981085 RepID=W9R8R6_9ROSA|nr:hypothetical protein L484_013648 [Morus notabilis]
MEGFSSSSSSDKGGCDEDNGASSEPTPANYKLLSLVRVNSSPTHRVESRSKYKPNLDCSASKAQVPGQEQARKALEGALGGKKNEFEKWNKEIKRREEAGGGGGAGGGGWFGSGRWFGWSNDDNFWQEAQQTSLAVLGIVIMYLIVAKGEVMLAVIFNPLLYALRGTRNGFTFVTSKILGKTSPHSLINSEIKSNEAYSRVSAKESVSRKWGSE